MSEIDNFEFKQLPMIDSRIKQLASSRKNETLRQCKEVIKLQYNALQAELNSHEKTKQQFDILKTENRQLLQQIMKIKNSLKQQKMSIQEYCNKINALENDQHKLQMQQNQNHKIISKFQKQKLQSQDQLQIQNKQNIILKEEISELELHLNQKNQKIRAAQESISLLIRQNKELKSKIIMNDQQQQWSVQELKQLNGTIRKNYKQMGQVCQLVSHHEFSPKTHIDIFPFDPSLEIENNQKYSNSNKKYMRSASSGKKRAYNCQNIPEFITTEISRKQNKSNRRQKSAKTRIQSAYSPKYYEHYNYSPEQSKLNNPQHHFTKRINNSRQNALGQQIKNIKQEIVNQYKIFNLKQENYSKQRVDNTLEKLKNKVSKFIVSANHEAQQQ